ncbi:unnamed protein product [Rotaria magnacalcarata]|uniref:Uncharacterized protein n=2 Tax=Rotaria magnacalcarata TaxID=392030 RepID=A0A816HD51_9BILA|nr:unnamed protein product [Rotaria magnacalcarata]CAF1686134.1 unnamed protein product [Rotaria magnacalcarata]CAF4748907.1 unnamed protein product [Rotaria magnacalcarata]CAF4986174.1 unnamed protein product [Rotaria magnacalcarata]
MINSTSTIFKALLIPDPDNGKLIVMIQKNYTSSTPNNPLKTVEDAIDEHDEEYDLTNVQYLDVNEDELDYDYDDGYCDEDYDYNSDGYDGEHNADDNNPKQSIKQIKMVQLINVHEDGKGL